MALVEVALAEWAGREDRQKHEETTMERINRLAEERRSIYMAAGRRPMTEAERNRVEEITLELYHLWDRLRRERAARRFARLTEERRVDRRRQPW